MRHNVATDIQPKPSLRPARLADLQALLALENQVFRTDRMSRRSLRRLIGAASAATIVAEAGGAIAGYAMLLFRPKAAAARLYSIAVRPDFAGQGVASALLAAAEEAAWARDCLAVRLEVHAGNARAIALYRKHGFRQFERKAGYYQDGGDALRFEKPLHRRLGAAPPYFHQTTEFTCGPACAIMALAWADRSFRPDPIVELQLWREATTIFMHGGTAGCEPFGLAVALARRGLRPEVHVSAPGPYFLNTVRDPEKRRVMRLAQEDFRRQAEALHIPASPAPLTETDLMGALERDAVAILLVSRYQLHRRGAPHWVFAYGRDGGRVLIHDPAATRDDQGRAEAIETYAVPWSRLDRLMSCGARGLRAAIIIRKGPAQ